jgi:hypothetical protein
MKEIVSQLGLGGHAADFDFGPMTERTGNPKSTQNDSVRSQAPTTVFIPLIRLKSVAWRP